MKRNPIRAIVAGLIFSLASSVRADTLELFAGGGEKAENVPATQAKLVEPFGIDFDRDGNAWIVELKGERLLKVDTKGILTIAAGTGKKGSTGDDGPGREATFNGMHSLAVHPETGDVYLADTWNNRIRKFDPKSGKVTAFAGTGKKGYGGDGGPAANADFAGVFCIDFDAKGTKLFVTDLENRRIRVVNMNTGIVSLHAGNGKGGVPMEKTEAKSSPLVDPRACCVDSIGKVYILERGGNALRLVGPGGKMRTVVGSGKRGLSGDGGPALEATMSGPKHLCVDGNDDVYIADTANHVIRKYSPKSETIVRIAGTGKKGFSGTGGDASETSFNEPHGVTIHRDGTLYVVDSMNHRIFRLKK
jgi:sugar lactone lactonase YvrE